MAEDGPVAEKVIKTPIKKPDSVRLALPSDEDRIFSLLVEMHRHNDRGWGVPYRPEIVLARIEAATRQVPATRSNPEDQRRGVIGLIHGPNGLIGSIGLFIEPVMWFSDRPCLQELWLFVRPTERVAKHYRDLFAFGLWAHDKMRGDLAGKWSAEFSYQTGFMHVGPRIGAMERLWRRASGAEKCGVLFMKR